MSAADNACQADPDWGCEARKRLGVARGALAAAKVEMMGMADELEGELRTTLGYVIEHIDTALTETAQLRPCKPAAPAESVALADWVHEARAWLAENDVDQTAARVTNLAHALHQAAEKGVPNAR